MRSLKANHGNRRQSTRSALAFAVVFLVCYLLNCPSVGMGASHSAILNPRISTDAHRFKYYFWYQGNDIISRNDLEHRFRLSLKNSYHKNEDPADMEWDNDLLGFEHQIKGCKKGECDSVKFIIDVTNGMLHVTIKWHDAAFSNNIGDQMHSGEDKDHPKEAKVSGCPYSTTDPSFASDCIESTLDEICETFTKHSYLHKEKLGAEPNGDTGSFCKE